MGSSRLRERWSPEQIAGFIRRCGSRLVSHQWIYELKITESNKAKKEEQVMSSPMSPYLPEFAKKDIAQTLAHFES